MAKKKTTTRKTRQTGSTSKAASVAPSNASSPSPQPQDLVLRRSPSQGDQSKGIVFSFRIQNDPELTMAVDILSYDQQNGPPEDDEQSAQQPQQQEAMSLDACSESEATKATGAQPSTTSTYSSQAQTQVKGQAQATTVTCLSHSNNTDPLSPGSSSCSSASESRWADSESTNPRMGEQWSSDPSLYRSSNVVDLSRNLLILHSRKPTQDPSHPHSFHPYNSTPRRKATSSSSSSSRSMSASPSEEPSTPCLTSGESSESSSPSSSPATPSSPASSSSLGTSHGKDELCLDSLPEPLDQIPTKSSRFLRVRGLGASGRRMQVILVS
ncbi:hypothetical protein BG003_004754 [Podila horticola]|nr:hypothetical protein BG003_004754 [Podila horticola]